MKNQLFFLLFLVFTSMISCKKDVDPYDQAWSYCRDNVDLKCIEPKNDLFFSGTLNDVDFCMSNGVEEYVTESAIAPESILSAEKPTLLPNNPISSSSFSFGIYPPIVSNTSGMLRPLSPYLYINTPSVKSKDLLKPTEYIDKYIKLGKLNLRDNSTDQYSGFNLVLAWVYPYSGGVLGTVLSPSYGVQNNPVFEVTEFKKDVQLNNIIYDITFKVTCDLYYVNSEMIYGYHGRLRNGIFKTRVILPVDQ